MKKKFKKIYSKEWYKKKTKKVKSKTTKKSKRKVRRNNSFGLGTFKLDLGF